MPNYFKLFINLFKPRCKLKILSPEETIDYILKHKCSISRFGDGELWLMEGGNIGFQKSNPALAEKLKKVRTTDKCLACLPDIFDKSRFNRKVLTSKEVAVWSAESRALGPVMKKYFSQNSVIGNASLTRFYIRFKKHDNTPDYIKKIKQLWEGRDVIMVEGEQTRLGVANDFFSNAKSTRRILCPAEGAFDKYDSIVAAIKKHAKPTDLILSALGPTATALAYEMSEEYQVLDIGHVDIEYEWYKMGAKKTSVVTNKYVNEHKKGREFTELKDEKYLSEIIERV